MRFHRTRRRPLAVDVGHCGQTPSRDLQRTAAALENAARGGARIGLTLSRESALLATGGELTAVGAFAYPRRGGPVRARERASRRKTLD